MGGWGGGGDGGPHVERVAARVEDLRAFCEDGERFVPTLIGILDTIADARATTTAAMGATDTPLARVAKRGYDGGTDPMAELIAEARIGNAFVETVYESLESGDFTIDGLRSVPAARIDGSLRAAGLVQVGEDATLQEDQALAAVLVAFDVDQVRENLTDEQRAEVAAYQAQLDVPAGRAVPVRVADIEDPDVRLIVADLIIEQAIADSRDPGRPAHLPFGHEPWMGINSLVQDIEGTELQAFVAQRLVEEGPALEAEVGHPAASPGPVPRQLQETATVMVTLGLGAMTEQQLSGVVENLDGDPDRAELIIQALDLDGDESSLLDEYAATGIAPVGLGDRQRVLTAVLEVAVDDEGLLRAGGHMLFEASIDGLTAAGWHPGLPSEDNVGTPGNDLRVALVTIAGAPNFGLTEAEYHQTLEVDRLLAELPELPTDEEWRQLDAALAALGDAGTVDFILSAMVADLSAAEALRIARSAAAAPAGPYDYWPDFSPTDERVDLLRLLLGTDAMGNPPLVETALDGGVPEAAGGSLISELRILQALQMQRWNEGRSVEAEPPLSVDQLELVADFEARLGDVTDLAQALWSKRLAEAGGGSILVGPTWPTQYETLLAIAAGELEADPELVELAAQLTDPSAAEVWGILLAAPGNSKFLNPDGSFGGYDDDFDPRLLKLPGHEVTANNFTSLTVQLLLHDELAPTAALLDGNGDGLITENDREAWLEANGGNIPPILRDRITFGAGFGLGHDDWGWDELAQGLGIIGLTAAVVVSVVYSGGTAAPLWVKAGLVTLAGAEAIAAFHAGDNMGAGLALLGGAADAVSFVRLLANGRRIPTGALISLADNPGVWDEVSDLEKARAYAAMVTDARGSNIPAIRALADESAGLSPAEFLNRYLIIAADNPDAFLAQIADPIRRTIARRQLDMVWEQRLSDYPPDVRTALGDLTPARQRAFYNELPPDQVEDVGRYGHDNALGVLRRNQDGDLIVSFPADGIEVVVRGTPDYQHELDQIVEFMHHEGGGGRFDFLGRSSQGIEGFFIPPGTTRRVPISLKGFQITGKLRNLLRRINDNADNVRRAGHAGDAVLFAQVDFTANEVAAFARNGPIANMPSEGVFSQLIFQATDGFVVVTADGVTIGR